MENLTFEDGFDLACEVFQQVANKHFDTGMLLSDFYGILEEKFLEIRDHYRQHRTDKIMEIYPKLKTIIEEEKPEIPDI